ncbi:MAG: type II CAAX endopeptidase family protein [Planctomycetota bacterium]
MTPRTLGSRLASLGVTALGAAVAVIAALRVGDAGYAWFARALGAGYGSESQGLRWIAWLVPMMTTLAAAVLVAGLATRIGFGRALAFRRPGIGTRGVALVLLGGGFLQYLGFVLLQSLFDEPTPGMADVMTSLRDARWPSAWIVLAGLAFLPAIGEELLFRGWLQHRLGTALHPVVALLVTSTLFALWHRDPQHVASVAPGAIYFGYVFWHTRSLPLTMALHAFDNAVVFLAVNAGLVREDGLHPGLRIAAFVVALPALVGAILVLERRHRAAPSAIRPSR